MVSKAPLFQSQIWQDFQNTLPGRQTGKIVKNSETLFWVIIPTVFRYNYLYINRGPEHSLLPFWDELLNIAQENRCIYIKIEPNWQKNSEYVTEIKKLGLRKSPLSIQPDTTLLLDLTKSEQDLLKEMKSKGRYNIKIAQKYGITYQRFTAKDKNFEQALQGFYQLLKDTAKRDKFGVHTYEYYEKLLQKLSPHGQLYLAYQNDMILAGIIAVVYGNTTTYYYGASASIARETMATYGLQWQVIGEAKKAGFSVYDFLGIAPDDAKTNHPWRGVTDFKKKFGGSVYSYAGTYHFVLKPFLYFFLNVSKILLQARKTFSR